MTSNSAHAVAARERDPLWLLISDHPPAYRWIPPNTLFDPPGPFSRTASWVEYRGRLDRYPADEWRRHLIEQAEQVLSWRASVPPNFRFWSD